MANQNKIEEIDVHLLKQNRPDLWPTFTQTLKTQAPDFYALINSDTANFLKQTYGGKLLLKISELPAKAQYMIIVATKQKQGRRIDRTKPINIKNKRPDLWPNFLAILEQHDKAKFKQINSHIDDIIWFVDDLPHFAQSIIDQAINEAKKQELHNAK